MYRGKNQEQYIAKKYRKHTYMPCGEESPECLKRVFFGDPCL